MVAFTSVLGLAVTFAATQVLGTPADAVHELLARQAAPPTFSPGTIPQQCSSQCAKLETDMGNNCTDLTCICGPTVANDMIACLQCGASIVGAATAQSEYSQYSSACQSVGMNVPAFTTTGGSSGSSGSTGSNSTSGSTGSASPTSGSTGSSNSTGGSTGSSNSNSNHNGAMGVQLAGASVIGAVALALSLIA